MIKALFLVLVLSPLLTSCAHYLSPRGRAYKAIVYQNSIPPNGMPNLIFFEKINSVTAIKTIDSGVVYGQWRQVKDTIFLSFFDAMSGKQKGRIGRNIIERLSYISIEFSGISYSQITKEIRKNKAPIGALLFL
jgi:hypothetical protein